MKKQEDLDNFNRTSVQPDILMTLPTDTVKSIFWHRFLELRAIINRYDPAKLLEPDGTPEDEYEAEVKTIIIQLRRKMTEKDIYRLICQEFAIWFSPRVIEDKELFQKMAKDIYEWIQITWP